jgi:hypothetical protein
MIVDVAGIEAQHEGAEPGVQHIPVRRDVEIERGSIVSFVDATQRYQVLPYQ